MSRSYKHTPVFWNARGKCGSGKWYKRFVWHVERARLRTALRNGRFELIEKRLKIYNEWEAPGDGRYYRANFRPRYGYGVHNHRRSSADDEYLFIKAMRK